MKTIKQYNRYMFISTFTRNIIDVYSVIFLYKKGIPINNIIAIYALTYFIGIIINYLTIHIGNKIGYKYVLILSSIITSITFYIINNITNIYLISLFLSLSMFTYHPIRHLYGIKILKEKKNIGNTLISIYLSNFLSSYLIIKNINLIYLIIISVVSIIPAIFIEREAPTNITYPKKIPKYKLNFFIFDQFKIIFILLEPLYIYLLINNISYIGIFNIILTTASIICIYIISNKTNLTKKYKYLNIIFTIILLIKLNVKNKKLLLTIAFLEGIGIKINELASTINLYSSKELTEGYIILSEIIFCLTRTIILCIIYFLSLNLKIILYMLLIGIFILSFQYKKDTT